jgi:hypothetical protein
VSRFHDDDNAQKAVRDAVLGPGFYGPFSLDGRYVFIDKGRLATILQKRFAVDTILQRTNGAATCIEEKIVRWPGKEYTAIVLETKSCTVLDHESDGWMVYGQADWLNYVMCQKNGNLLCHIIDFALLQAKFWEVFSQFPETVSKQHNRTACRVVPLQWVRDNVPIYSRQVFATPEGAEIVKAYNQTHYKKRATA